MIHLKMRAISSTTAMAALILGLIAILVPFVTEAAVAAKPNAPAQGVDVLEDEIYQPYQGQRFDEFDWRLCKKLAKKYSGNMLISPISIKLALVLLYEGAQGQTAHELAGALQLPSLHSAVRDRFVSILRSLQTVRPEYEFDISTRLIVDSPVKPTQTYSSVVKTFYSTDVVVGNFADSRTALKEINDWVSNVTHGHVKEILTDAEKLKESVFLVLNALYFRGTWRQPFWLNATRPGQFFIDVDKSVEVPYMHAVGRYRYADATDLDAQILRLPYLGQKYAMYIVLPRARAGIRQLTDELNPFMVRRHIEQMEEVPVDVSIPKFKLDFTTHLETVLRELGIRDIFDNTANFVSIARAKQWGQRLIVSDFVQKAGLEVDEVGTTAHAVTEVQIGNKISDRTFHVNHPFLYFIEDETTGTVIFVGKVVNPMVMKGTLEEQPESSTPTRMGAESPSAVPGPALVAPVQGIDLDDRFNFFDIDLLEALTADGDDNVVVSPASVKAALTTLVEGTGGRTAEQILTLLRLPSDSAGIRSAAKRSLAPFQVRRDGAELDFATRLWAGHDVAVNQKYRNIIRENYGSEIEPVNFGDPAGYSSAINNWVYQQTRGQIQSIVAPGSLSAGTKLLLTNALYLKGNWKKSFNQDLTSIRCFQVPNLGCQDSYLMQSISYYPYAYIPALDASVVEIPYADGRLSMMIVLPERPEDGINRLSRDLAHTPLSSIANLLEETDVILTIPRFTIETKMDMRPVLESLGVRDLFDLNANISGITDGPVQVGSVLHNAKIQVNEKGTIAAAVSAVSVVPLMGSTVQRFRADRPFIFILRESESGGVLFAGRVTRPDPVSGQGVDRNTNTSSARRLRRTGV